MQRVHSLAVKVHVSFLATFKSEAPSERQLHKLLTNPSRANRPAAKLFPYALEVAKAHSDIVVHATFHYANAENPINP